MEITKVKIVIVLTVLSLLSCSRTKPFGIMLQSGFNNDKVKIFYANKIILDSTLITNESIQVAHRIILPKIAENYLSVFINNKTSDSIIVKKNICRVFISYRNSEIKFYLDSVCKPIKFY